MAESPSLETHPRLARPTSPTPRRRAAGFVFLSVLFAMTPPSVADEPQPDDDPARSAPTAQANTTTPPAGEQAAADESQQHPLPPTESAPTAGKDDKQDAGGPEQLDARLALGR